MSDLLSVGIFAGPLRADPERMLALDLCAALRRAGVEISVFGADGPLRARFEGAGAALAVEGLTGRFLLDLPKLKALRRAVAGAGVDVTLVADSDFARHAVALSRISGIPHILVLHAEGGKPARTSRGAGTVLVPTPAVRDSLLLSGGIAPESIRVVPPGVDASRFPSPPTPCVGGRRIVGALSALDRAAGLRHLVEAVHQLSTAGRSIHLLVAGSGPEDEALRRFSRDAGAARLVTITEMPADFESVVNTMDLVVFPAVEDGYSLGILQAMAAARPVVATGVGSTFSWVREGVTGLLAPKGRPSELAERIAWLLDHPLRAVEMGLSGRRAVLDGHGIESMTETVLDLLRETVAEGAAA